MIFYDEVSTMMIWEIIATTDFHGLKQLFKTTGGIER